jgi:metallophosphoesterase superfamily enzyme
MLSSFPSSSIARTEVCPGVWLDARLALWLAAERLLIIADLHWGYAASHRARGNLLPWWGDDDIEQRLRALLDD